MGIEYVAGANSGNGGGSVTINVPTGTLNQDVLIAGIWYVNSDAPTPSGWTLLQTGLFNVSTASLKVFRRVANSEPASYAFGGGSSNFTFGFIDAFRGVNNTTPEDVATPASVDNVTSATITWPTITTVTPGAWHLALVADWVSVATISGPTGYAVRGIGPVNTKASQNATKEISAPGPVGGVTATYTADTHTAISVALRPVTGAQPEAYPRDLDPLEMVFEWGGNPRRKLGLKRGWGDPR